MPRLSSILPPLVLALSTSLLLATPAAADSCDLLNLPLAVPATLPSGCALAVYDYTGQVPGMDWHQAAPPAVGIRTEGRDPVPAAVAIADSPTRIRLARHEWCDQGTCTDRSWSGDLDGVRYDITFLAPLAVGTVVEIGPAVGAVGSVTITEPGVCPVPTAPTPSCSLGLCSLDCQPPVPCDGGVSTRDAGVGSDGGTRDGGPGGPIPPDGGACGCNASSGSATPLVLVALGLAALIRRRRRG